MSGDAGFTFLGDKDAATHFLANLVARSQLLGEQVGRLAARIADLEAGQPWGHAKEYGKEFERAYHAGGHGARYVREQTGVVAESAAHGARTAFGAVQATVEVDLNGAGLFKTADSDAVGTRLKDIGTARTETGSPAPGE